MLSHRSLSFWSRPNPSLASSFWKFGVLCSLRSLLRCWVSTSLNPPGSEAAGPFAYAVPAAQGRPPSFPSPSSGSFCPCSGFRSHLLPRKAFWITSGTSERICSYSPDVRFLQLTGLGETGLHWRKCKVRFSPCPSTAGASSSCPGLSQDGPSPPMTHAGTTISAFLSFCYLYIFSPLRGCFSSCFC